MQDGVAIIRMDDGKRNTLSLAMVKALNDALDQATRDNAIVLLTGRSEVFSAGFDLKQVKAGGGDALSMFRLGFGLVRRLLSFPTPVVVVCNGHSLAMGLFLTLSADYSVGAEGNYQLGANEVAIGLTMPRVGLLACKHRLPPSHYSRVALLAETYDPQCALKAGILDQVVASDRVEAVAFEHAESLLKLDLKAHYQSKIKARAATLRALKIALTLDLCDIVLEGMRRMIAAKRSHALN